MALLDILKGIVGAFADEANRNASRLERKYGNRLNESDRSRLERVKKTSSRLKDWSK